VNKVTHTLGPRMIKDLRKAALGYVNWKQTQVHFRKPWRYPEDITVPRILIEDCWEAADMNDPSSTPSTPVTPVKSKPKKIPQSNGDDINVNLNSNSKSASNSPITVQKKPTKKKFKFKFDK